jgi:hypothetical protein
MIEESVQKNGSGRKALDLTAISCIFDNRLTKTAEDIRLGAERGILPTFLLVEIVTEQDLQCFSSSYGVPRRVQA